MKRPWLAPFIPLYAAGAALSNLRFEKGWAPVRRLRWPVVSIGNLSTGGSGKTPLAIALARLLIAQGFRVDVLSRGYGRRSARPLSVNPDGTAEEFGDEPLLIARETGVPVYVAPRRYDAGLLAEADEDVSQNQRRPQVHILDDGFQHRQLARDVDILLLNRADWCDTLLPAGNLREPLAAAKRATIFAIPANDPDLEGELRHWGVQVPIWRLQRHMEVPALEGAAAAFCGIARPGQFFAGLEAAGLHLAARTCFPDHHRYTAADLGSLLAQARASGAAALVTTEKDAVRLGGLVSSVPADLPVRTARLTIQFADENAAVESLMSFLRDAQPLPPL